MDYQKGISIIIPVFNAEAFIEKCLNSVVNQTLKELDIICVIDKNSTDNSVAICQKYAQEDNRIRVLTPQKGTGAGYNRNIGIETITKEYTGFVDADDYTDNDYFEKLYSCAQSYDADIAMAEIKVIDYETNTVGFERRYPYTIEYTIYDKMSLIQEGVCWDKIYKTDLIHKNNIRFPENVLHEDNMFTLEVLEAANKLITVPGIFYHWIRNSGSVCFNNDYETKRRDDANTVMDMVIQHVKNKKYNYATSKLIFDFMVSHFGVLALQSQEYRIPLAIALNTALKNAKDYYE
ncbi:MAG: glycosyltransferase [Cyanobacteria bacterium RUI128]|nr:glycosyltransferase [Cyanobacteria bacterium RUI128]